MLILHCPNCGIMADETELAPGYEAHLKRADAASTDDAFIAFYKRDTVPTTDVDRAACTGKVVESGSPESNNSNYCPGMRKASNNGLILAPCEKGVIQVQPWDSASTFYTMPPTLKVSAELP